VLKKYYSFLVNVVN